MRLLVVGAALAAVSLHGPAIANGSDQQAKAAKKDRVVCRSSIVTGTRFDKRECKTAAEWEQRAEAAADAWREQLSRPLSPEDLKALPSRTCPVGC